MLQVESGDDDCHLEADAVGGKEGQGTGALIIKCRDPDLRFVL